MATASTGTAGNVGGKVGGRTNRLLRQRRSRGGAGARCSAHWSRLVFAHVQQSAALGGRLWLASETHRSTTARLRVLHAKSRASSCMKSTE